MSDRAATVLLGPVLWLQGRHVRRATPRLPEPPGPREGRTGDGPPLRLLLCGDSAAAGVGAAHQDEALAGRLVADLAADRAVSWRLVARTGATSAGTLRRLENEPAAPWDVVVTSLGVNDVTGVGPVKAWLAVQREIVALCRSRFAVGQVVLSGLPPMHLFPALPQPLRWHLGRRARRFDAALAAWASTQPGVRHLPAGFAADVALMAPDGFHPGPAGYAVWATHLAAAIRG